VLLVEAGRASHPYSRFPISFGLLIDNPAANWRYESDPEPAPPTAQFPCRAASAGRLERHQRLVWVRGQTLDYDTWAQMGARGWSWQDVAPLFTRIECYENGEPTDVAAAGPLRVPEGARSEPAIRRAVQGRRRRRLQAQSRLTTARTRKASSRHRPASAEADA
jgi:choline dehydrogenase